MSSWNLFAGWQQGTGGRPPLAGGGMLGMRRRNKAKLSKRASAEVSQFKNGTMTGAFILTKEDLKVMELQGQLDGRRREGITQAANFRDELEILNLVHSNMKQQIAGRLQDDSNVNEYYQHAIQIEFLQAGIPMQGEGDGLYEAGILRKTHEAAVYENIQTMYSRQNSAELVEIYRTVPRLKEEFEETHKRLNKEILQQTIVHKKRKALLDKILKLQKHINAGYKRASESKFDRTYENLRPGSNHSRGSKNSEGNDGGDDDDDDDSSELKVRGGRGRTLTKAPAASNRPELSKMSYSQRVLDIDKEHLRRSPSPAGAEERRRKLAAESAAASRTARAASSSPERRTPKVRSTLASRRAAAATRNGSTSSNGSSGPVTRRPHTKGTTSRTRSPAPGSVSRRAGAATTTSGDDVKSPTSKTAARSNSSSTTITTTTTSKDDKKVNKDNNKDDNNSTSSSKETEKAPSTPRSPRRTARPTVGRGPITPRSATRRTASSASAKSSPSAKSTSATSSTVDSTASTEPTTSTSSTTTTDTTTTTSRTARTKKKKRESITPTMATRGNVPIVDSDMVTPRVANKASVRGPRTNSSASTTSSSSTGSASANGTKTTATTRRTARAPVVRTTNASRARAAASSQRSSGSSQK